MRVPDPKHPLVELYFPGEDDTLGNLLASTIWAQDENTIEAAGYTMEHPFTPNLQSGKLVCTLVIRFYAVHPFQEYRKILNAKISHYVSDTLDPMIQEAKEKFSRKA